MYCDLLLLKKTWKEVQKGFVERKCGAENEGGVGGGISYHGLLSLKKNVQISPAGLRRERSERREVRGGGVQGTFLRSVILYAWKKNCAEVISGAPQRKRERGKG